MADTIKFKCKSCEKKISVRAEYAGKKAKCPGCKKPLRVPSPRPKRSATGVPIGTESDSGSSGAGLKSYSLADLAEMEANADVQLRELTSKVINKAGSARIKGGKDCPDCASSVKAEAVLCINCGHNFDSGKRTKTQKTSTLGRLFGRGKV